MGKQDNQGVTAGLFRPGALIVTVVTLLTHNLSSAQAYRPMLGDGAKWGEYYFGFYTEVYVRVLAGDSLIDGHSYKQQEVLGNPVGHCARLLREDTVERKVYFHDDTSGDLLLYDFSLLPGDTGTVYQCSEDPSDTGLYAYDIFLDSISNQPPAGVTTLIDGPRFFYGHGTVDSQILPFIWLEGVGSFHGLEMARPLDESFGWLRLTCHSDPGGFVDYTAEGPWGQDTCFSVYSLNSITENGLPDISVTPNPTSGRLRVTWRSGSMASGEFLLLNIRGQVVRRFQPGRSSVGVDLDISEQPAGLCLLRYSDQEGTHWESKVIKE